MLELTAFDLSTDEELVLDLLVGDELWLVLATVTEGRRVAEIIEVSLLFAGTEGFI